MIDEEERPSETFGQALERIAAGGLLRLIVSKPVQQAIGRLVYGMTDVPVAQLEQWSQSIRSNTAARKQIASAIATAARALAAEDSELIARGLERWTRQLGAKQKARDDIGIRTLNILAEEDMAPEETVPSEEFMSMFEDIAERATSDAVADLMARILAGEIRKPRSVSRRTLQVVAVLDQEIVTTMNSIKPYLLDPDWLHIPPQKVHEWREKISLLSSVSVTTDVGLRMFTFDEHGRAAVQMGDKAIVSTSEPSNLTMFVDGANLTPIGKELINVLPLTGERKLREVALGIKQHSFIKNVIICDADHIDKLPHGTNQEEVN